MSDSDLSAIKRDIRTARDWAKKRWPSEVQKTGDKLEDGLRAVLSTTFKVTFPEPDTMEVVPVFIGQETTLATCRFRLCWDRGGLWWVGEMSARVELWGERARGEIRHYVGKAEGNPAKERPEGR